MSAIYVEYHHYILHLSLLKMERNLPCTFTVRVSEQSQKNQPYFNILPWKKSSQNISTIQILYFLRIFNFNSVKKAGRMFDL